MFTVKNIIQYWLLYVVFIILLTLLLEFEIIDFTILNFRPAIIWTLILFIYIIGFEILHLGLLSIYDNIVFLTFVYAVKEIVTIFLLTIVAFFILISFYSYKPDILRDEFVLVVLITLLVSIIAYWQYTKLDVGNFIEIIIKKIVEFIFGESNPVPLAKDFKAKINPNNIEKIIVMAGIIITVLIVANSVFNNISIPSLQETPEAFNYEIGLMISIISVYALNLYLLIKSLDFKDFGN